MTVDQKVDIFRMRMEGYTLREIGEKYGITRERVRQILMYSIDKREVKARKVYVYPEIKNWMEENRIRQEDIGKDLGYSQQSVSYILNGRREPNLEFIKYICDKTGLDVNTAFRRKDNVSGM